MTRSITFLYPSRNMGGAQFLFLRMATQLAKTYPMGVNYVDYCGDGFAAKHLPVSSDVTLIPYQQGYVPLKNTTVVASTFHIPLIRMMLGASVFKPENNVRFIFWTIHPENARLALMAGTRQFLPNLSRRKRIIRQLANQGNIVFMDGANHEAFEKTVGSVKNPILIPISTPFHPARVLRTRPQDGKVCICWLGRLDSDKHQSVRKIINDIALLPKKNDVYLLVVGGGTYETQLIDLAKTKGVRLELAGYLHGPELHQKLLTDVDLGISMGTSCLEIAGLGIPSALIDFSMSSLPDGVNYDWIFKSENYDVGRQASLETARAWTLSDLIAQIKEDDSIAQKCKEYIIQNHNIETVAPLLVQHSETNIPLIHERDILVLLPRSMQKLMTWMRRAKHLLRK